MAIVESRLPLAMVLMLALGVRLIAASLVPDQSGALHDVESFRHAAETLGDSGQIYSMFVMPLYPVLIAATGAGWGQLAADIVLSVLTVWLLHELAFAIFADRRIALLAALVAALYPPLIFFSVVGLSETLFIGLVIAAFLFWYRSQFVLAAVFSVLAVLTRPIFDLAAILLVLCFIVVVHGLSFGAAARHIVLYAAIYAALMSPWWVHNYVLHGTFVRLNLGFGTALYAGNNPLGHSGGGNMGEDYDLARFEGIKDRVARDRALRVAAMDYIAENPAGFFERAMAKFIRMWRPWPRHEAYAGRLAMLAALFSYIPVLGLAFGYVVLRGRRDLRRISPILLYIGYFTAVHMILVGTIRYRLPLEPFLIVFAAAGFVELVRRRWPDGNMMLSRRHNAPERTQ